MLCPTWARLADRGCCLAPLFFAAGSRAFAAHLRGQQHQAAVRRQLAEGGEVPAWLVGGGEAEGGEGTLLGEDDEDEFGGGTVGSTLC